MENKPGEAATRKGSYPAPPADLLMQIANDPSAESFVGSFPHVRTGVAEYLGRAGYRLGEFSNVLDFGCGVGRFLFAMHEAAHPGQCLHGCDIDTRCVDWCRENIDFAGVKLSTLEPPLPYGDGEFDLVYALSVFTHLSLEWQFAWARELARVLKPGGVLFVSTHGLMFMQQIMAVRENWTHSEFALIGSDGLFGAFAEGSGRALEGQRGIATVHTRDAVAAIFSALNLRYHEAISGMAGGQSISILEKPPGAAAPQLPLAAYSGLANLAPGQAESGVHRYRFAETGGPSVLRFFLVFDHARRDCVRFKVRCRVVQGAAGATVCSETLPLPVNVVSGDHHFLPFALTLPAFSAPVEVELQLCLAPGQAPFAETVPFSWRFPRIE
jgi:SAM-dependent methyltransferase